MNSERPNDDDLNDSLVSFEAAGLENYREYEFTCPVTGMEHTYRVDMPVSVEYRLGGTTHRVTDHNDVTHIVPAPGFYGCVIRIGNRREAV